MECGDGILTKSSTERDAQADGVAPATGTTDPVEKQMDEGVCPISGDDLWRFFTALIHQDTYSTRMLQKVVPFALQWLACPLPHD